MISALVKLFLAVGLMSFATAALAAPAPERCPALVKQDEECRAIAEKRQALCPEGGSSAECRGLSEQIAGKCTRSPCAAPRKAKAKRGRAKRARSKRR
jgi:hypothetical protein